jgi:putative endonuclease
MAMAFFVYIVASKRNGTLYIGMTDDLLKRAWQHRHGIIPGFTRDHNVKSLVWYEVHDSRESAIVRERQMKKWNRAWKLELIESHNPNWRDLGETLTP